MKEKNVLKFYVLATTLKNKVRSGLLLWKVDKDRLESVAEHIYGTCILAIGIDSEYDLDIDLNKVLKMLVLHELEEVIIGDLTPFDEVTKEEKLNSGKEAVSKILKDLVKKEEYEILLDEFNSHITNESIFAYMCDKMECDIQMKLYEDLGCNDLNKEDLKPLKNKKIQELIDNGSNTIADIFIEYDKELYKDNKVFLSILDYIKKNNLKDLLEIE
ncbi:MAG: HD domain-containing protein [Lactobacillales bacterium]|nr:HD domain-containing protein [Lactobacillales bacterium]